MSERTYILYRDGEEVTRGAWIGLVRYIHANHCYSFQHACDYEGYSWAESSPTESNDEPHGKE